LVLVGFFGIFFFSGCEKSELPRNGEYPGYAAYRDIPGVTEEEIAAIEGIRRQNPSLVYGMLFSSECFDSKDGIGGFSALFCEWLTDLFDIPFTPKIYGWKELLDGLASEEIDFTGELGNTGEHQRPYYMTGTVVERFVSEVKLRSAPALRETARFRKPRLGFFSQSHTPVHIRANVRYEFEDLYFDSAGEAYLMVQDGTLDAFIIESPAGIAERYEDLTEEPFLPYVYTSASLATASEQLAPVISVVQKYLNSGASHHLGQLYSRGTGDFLRYRFFQSLSAGELDYVNRHSSAGNYIPLGIEKDNYPVGFYNSTEKQWQGIAFDMLTEIESITGLHFKVVSHPNAEWTKILYSLEQGETALVTELIRTGGRENRFLWGTPYIRDSYALISKVEHDDVNINDLFYSQIGLITDSAYAEVFREWFPGHQNVKEYASIKGALSALEKGDVEMIMGSKNMLLTLTNYREEPGYKTALIFKRTFGSSFGFNRNEEILRSVMNKAQSLVDTEIISARWTSRVFDYRHKLIRSRQPYLISSLVMLGIAVFLLITFLQRFIAAGKQLEAMVLRRTAELEERGHELEIQKAAAQTAYKVKNRFLANMSHEIRTPLNAIIGLSELELAKSHTEESLDNLQLMNRSGSALLGVINALLNISNIESGELELKCAPYSLAELIHNAVSFATTCLGKKKVSFKLALDKQLPANLFGDMQRVRQVLDNLLSNAVKFTREGSITLLIGFAQSSPEAIKLFIEIRDTGTGIKNEQLAKIFTEYNQIDTASPEGGTGMGLIVSRKLAEMMGGTILAASKYGEGSTFTMMILQEISGDELIGADAEKLEKFTYESKPSHQDQKKQLMLPYARVLVVDDVPTNLAVARGVLKRYCITVDTASSGKEAVDLIRKAGVHYDAIFMDHMMPGMDGMEATRIIREEIATDYAKSIPIIALTANAIPGNEKLFCSRGFNAFMTKPIDIMTLEKVLESWVWDEEKEKNLSDYAEGGLPPQDLSPEDPALKMLSGVEIEGMDLKAGADMFGSMENYLQIVKIFISDTPKLLETIRDMSARITEDPETLKNYSIIVHGIKGSCYGICAAALGDHARKLEFAAKGGELRLIREQNGPFIEAAETLINKLKSILPQDKKADRPRKEKPDPELLNELREAARGYNTTRIFEILDEIEQFSYETNLITTLRDAADNYEYAEIINLLEQYSDLEENLKSLR
jgi:signal transduction histidine kinase/AmiR/NasT family two-component response regulator